jgi:hypothetical protein
LIRVLVAAAFLVLFAPAAGAQTATAPGFIETRNFLFPEKAPNDSTRAVSDWLWRQEGFLRPASWLQFVAGIDLRANTHDQVEDVWRIDWEDRHLRPPRVSIRRLAATVTAGRLTLDVGKQLIRWARADVLNPIDRFAPRDYLNVINSEFLPVIAGRASVELGPETFEAVWVPQLTPSRMPLLTQRWTVLPPLPAATSIIDRGSVFPRRAQAGGRWRHIGSRFEFGLSYFDGFNHHPNIDVGRLDNAGRLFSLTRTFPRLRTGGAELAIPTRWITLKGEAAWFGHPHSAVADYGLYVAELERQVGEWLLTLGYAGEVKESDQLSPAFDPERALAQSLLWRVAYTVDPRRTLTVEGVVRESADGYYVKAEFSQGFGEFWRFSITPVLLGGDADDFLGQYSNNSHLAVALRLSF